MIEPRLTDIDRGEVLRYLGYRGGAVTPDVEERLLGCESLLMHTAKPRAVWRVFNLLPDGSLAGCIYRPRGEDIRAVLRDCRQVILMAATLGTEAEALLRRAQARNMGDAVILDAAGSAAIETVCDNLCADLAAHFAPRFLTDRFSPGYGDLPLADQADFFRALDVTRRIGVSLTDTNLMIPQKSVTALIGISDTPQLRRTGCTDCNARESCALRKEGSRCGLF